MKEKKTPLSHEVVGFQVLDYETSNSKSEVSKSKLWKIILKGAPYEEMVNFYSEHFKGTKAMTRGHGDNRLRCHPEVSSLITF